MSSRATRGESGIQIKGGLEGGLGDSLYINEIIKVVKKVLKLSG